MPVACEARRSSGRVPFGWQGSSLSARGNDVPVVRRQSRGRLRFRLALGRGRLLVRNLRNRCFVGGFGRRILRGRCILPTRRSRQNKPHKPRRNQHYNHSTTHSHRFHGNLPRPECEPHRYTIVRSIIVGRIPRRKVFPARFAGTIVYAERHELPSRADTYLQRCILPRPPRPPEKDSSGLRKAILQANLALL